MSGPYVPLQSWFLSPSNFVALMLYIIGSATIAMLYIIGQYICLGFLRLVLKSRSELTPTWSYAYNKKGCPLQNALREISSSALKQIKTYPNLAQRQVSRELVTPTKHYGWCTNQLSHTCNHSSTITLRSAWNWGLIIYWVIFGEVLGFWFRV